MIVTTTSELTGYKIVKHCGVATGNVVRSKHMGRDIMAMFKTIVGGEIKGYTEMLAESRDIAAERMVEHAEQLGANAIINLRFTTSMVAIGMSEMMAYGTAVIVEKQVAETE